MYLAAQAQPIENREQTRSHGSANRLFFAFVRLPERVHIHSPRGGSTVNPRNEAVNSFGWKQRIFRSSSARYVTKAELASVNLLIRRRYEQAADYCLAAQYWDPLAYA
jgi:hypothetical protein